MTKFVEFCKIPKLLLAISFLTLSSVATAASGDATEIPPSPITNQTVQSPSATVTASNVANPATLPSCPIPPATISNCPDINGQGGSQATCPDTCTVSRIVKTNPAFSNAVAGFVPPVLSTTNPTCPVGYFPGQTFNPQPEYAYQTPATKSPVTQAAYNALNGVGCSKGSSMTTSGKPQGCGNGYGYACCNYGNPCASKVGNNQPYTGSTACYTGRNTIDDQTALFYITSAVWTWTNSGGICGPAAQGTWLASDNYNYTIAFVQCTPPAGYYPTGQTVNASTVCTRSKTQWKELNQ